ncbi:tetratricopeptide repeat protein [Neolewinella xylanilytica]|uniref:Tetratricopeptide repeat protein n=1 Tax=Neolewinella xylanilytica TaxID=1514080 RepID=A0A2S6IAL0_9BACT|nr:histidine kinase [Neolewinella xylanilytica]PPK88525.1 tetratricopeptide repeat protein [Neolewinella xylanilytica]
MVDRYGHSSALGKLELSLEKASDGLEVIEIIHSLLHHYVYTRPDRARVLLAKQAQLLQKHAKDLLQLEDITGNDYRLHYFLTLATLENQEYRLEHAAAPFATALSIVEERGDAADKLEAYLTYIAYLGNQGLTEQAIDYLDRCQRLLESYPSDQYVARTACRHGYLYLLIFSYPKATLKFLEAERLLEGGSFELTPQDHYYYSLTQSGLGSVYQNSGENELALAAFQRAIDRCELIGLRSRLPWHQLNLGKELMYLNKYEEAVTYFRAVVDTKANGSVNALAAAYANLGFCYHYLDSPDLANEYVDRAEALYSGDDEPDRKELAKLEFMRATLLMDSAEWEMSINQLNRILTLAEVDEDTNDPDLLSLVADAYLHLSICHAKLKYYEAAYNYHCTYDSYNHRFHQQVAILRQHQFAAQFRAEEREQENRQLKLKASQLKLRALRAQMNPHFMYNALNSIQMFISGNNAATASKHLAKFAMLMRQSLENANREFITLEEERRFLTDYLEINQHLRYEGNLTFHIVMDRELEEDVIGVPTMILQPYVENAIEHGLRGQSEGHIEVEFRVIDEDDHHLLGIVTDNGVGREKVRERQAKDATRVDHKSRGTEITESRLQLLSSEEQNWVEIIDLYDRDGVACGTQVRVTIPITEMIPRRNNLG